MEERVEEVKVGEKVFRCHKVDYTRLEKRRGYKSTAFPKVEGNGAEIEAAAAAAAVCISPEVPIEYTHFVSVPLSMYKSIRGSYVELRTAILSDKESPVDPDLFDPDTHLHLTITMLALDSKEKIEAAKKALIDAWEKAGKELKILPIRIHIKGLASFSKRADKTNLVYGSLVEDEGWERLMKLADLVIKQMLASKALEKEELSHVTYYPDQDVFKVDQLHMTLLNTKFKARIAGGKEKQYLFNPAPILKDYGNYEFGTITIERIELSKIRMNNPDTGYYLSEQTVPAPK